MKTNKLKGNYRIFVFIIVIFCFQFFKLIIYNDNIYQISGDGYLYVEYSEHFYNTGKYFANNSYNQRMPGFLPIYIPIRCFFNQENTLALFSIISLLLYSIASVLFSKKICEQFKLKGFSFYLLLFLLGFTDYATIWGYHFYTESLAISFLMLGYVFLYNALNNNRKRDFLYTSFFLTWVVFLRPFMIVIWFLILVIILILSLRKRMHYNCMFYYLLPLLLFIGSWTVRNYIVDRELIPLQAEWPFSETKMAYRKFIKTNGGDAVEWNPNSQGLWFQSDDYLSKNGFSRPPIDVFPDDVFDNEFTKDSLIALRNYYWISNDTSIEITTRKKAENIFVEEVENYVQRYQKEQPLNYYLISRFRLLKKFIIQPYTYYLPTNNKNPRLQLMLKVGIYLNNAIIFILGHLALLVVLLTLLLKKEKYKSNIVFILIIPLFLLALFPIYYGFVEYRFIVLSIPFLVAVIAIFLNKVYVFKFKRLFKLKQNK